MSKIAIKHCRKVKDYIEQEGTIAVELPTKETLLAMLGKHHDIFPLKMGVTLLHPKDVFNRKVGRETAMQKLSQELAEFQGMDVRDTGKYVLHFVVHPRHTPTPGKPIIQLGLSMVRDSENVRMEYCHIVSEKSVGVFL